MRTSTARSLFKCNASTVARPHTVRPIISVPSAVHSTMALPLLAAWVKESHPPARYGVPAMRLVTLGAVTQRTGQPQVGLIVAPTTGTWFDMLNVQRFVDIRLMRPTITAAIASLRNDPCPQGRSNVRHTPKPASQRPRRTASTIASDFSSSARSCSRNRWANSTVLLRGELAFLLVLQELV